MSKLDIVPLDAIVGEYYPCKVCGKPGVRWFTKGHSACADHLVEVDEMARRDHEKSLEALRNIGKVKP